MAEFSYHFPLFARVRKVRGYRWPGIIIMRGLTCAGLERYVVECTVEEVRGALHIFAPDQLVLDGEPDL